MPSQRKIDNFLGAVGTNTDSEVATNLSLAITAQLEANTLADIFLALCTALATILANHPDMDDEMRDVVLAAIPDATRQVLRAFNERKPTFN